MSAPLCEVRVFSRRHRFAGTLDVLGVWHGCGALLDYKTGDPRDVAADLQTSAYLGAYLEMQAAGETERPTFDPFLHEYKLDGERLPSVTQVLQRAGLIDFSHIPPAILAAARDRGSAVHQAVHYVNEGDLDPHFEEEFPEYAPYVRAWALFLDESGFRFANETELGDLSHIKRYAIRLRPDGLYAIEAYGNPRDYTEFLALLRAQQIVDRRRPHAHIEVAA